MTGGLCWKVKTNKFLSQFHRRRDRLVVRTLRCGRSNPGSNPGHGTVLFFFYVLYRLKLPYHKQKTFSFAINENITKWLVSDRPRMSKEPQIQRRVQDKYVLVSFHFIERFSYDLEVKTREQNKNNKRTEIKRFDWFIERIQTRVAFGWLSERSAEKTSCPKNFLEIALTSYCSAIGQSNNAFSILGFSLAGKRRVHFLFFSSIGW